MSKFSAQPYRLAFTLIELLIVIVIIGILAGVILVVLNPAAQQRKSAEAVLQANTNKLCLGLFSCAQTTYDPLRCNDMTKIGGIDPIDSPSTSTYDVLATGNVISVTGTLPAGVGSSVDCEFTCAYDIVSGTPQRLTQGAGCIL